jgi:hypothetical protein
MSVVINNLWFLGAAYIILSAVALVWSLTKNGGYGGPSDGTRGFD